MLALPTFVRAVISPSQDYATSLSHTPLSLRHEIYHVLIRSRSLYFSLALTSDLFLCSCRGLLVLFLKG